LVWLFGFVAFVQRAQLPPDLQSRVPLTNEHVDLRVLYDATAETNALSLVVRDEDLRINHDATNVVIRVPESAKLLLPPGFDAFGTEGDPLWILPQSQDPNLMYLGISAEGIGGGLFTGPITVRLLSVEGPGSFFLWQFDAFSGLRMVMNSRDGISEADAAQPFTGSHEHFNWGFSANGIHAVTFQAAARRPGETNDILSLPTTIVFAVEPLPDLPPPNAWQLWQSEQWPGITDPTIIGPQADPDADGFPNLLEFFGGTNPRQSSSRPQLQLSVQRNPTSGDIRDVTLQLAGRPDVSGLVEVWAEASPTMDWTSPTQLKLSQTLENTGNGLVLWNAIDTSATGNPARRVYRVAARLK
jgi:surface-anchored protein